MSLPLGAAAPAPTLTLSAGDRGLLTVPGRGDDVSLVLLSDVGAWTLYPSLGSTASELGDPGHEPQVLVPSKPQLVSPAVKGREPGVLVRNAGHCSPPPTTGMCLLFCGEAVGGGGGGR